MYLPSCSSYPCKASTDIEEAKKWCNEDEACGGLTWSFCCHGITPDGWAYELRAGRIAKAGPAFPV